MNDPADQHIVPGPGIVPLSDAEAPDPRFVSGHLYQPRRGLYGAARREVLDSLGETTAEVDRIRPSHRPTGSFVLPTGYALQHKATGLLWPLRVGITTLGRIEDSDLILPHYAISRRHCVVIVHATGGCEVRNTASRNGTMVNGRKVEQAQLRPGDCLRLCDFRFVVFGPEGNVSDRAVEIEPDSTERELI